MTKEVIEKLHDLEFLYKKAEYMICNGDPDTDSIKSLYRFDESFKKELNDMWKRYRDKYKKEIDEL